VSLAMWAIDQNRVRHRAAGRRPLSGTVHL